MACGSSHAPARHDADMITLKHILVPTDLGEPAKRALGFAIDLAAKFDGRITLVHVFDVPLSYAGMDLSPMDLLAPVWAAAREQLDALLTEVKRSNPDARLIVARGVPWREILATIEKEQPDLVVMGTHGRSGIGRALLGSVAEKIVRLSPAPVLTLRDDTEE